MADNFDSSELSEAVGNLLNDRAKLYAQSLIDSGKGELDYTIQIYVIDKDEKKAERRLKAILQSAYDSSIVTEIVDSVLKAAGVDVDSSEAINKFNKYVQEHIENYVHNYEDN